MKPRAIVIGAGIVGLATARALALKGFKVTVFERNEAAQGASIRNFGMIWPIGQPEGVLYERAARTKSIWKELLTHGRLWHEESGSLHAVYQSDEAEFAEQFAKERNSPVIQMLTSAEALKRSQALNPRDLKGALWSSAEMILDPRQAISALPDILSKKFEISFEWNITVTGISYPNVYSGSKIWSADIVFVCSGADFETLYPEEFRQAPLTKSKLQMMRLESQPNDWRIGPSLCGALSFLHYDSFKTNHQEKLKRRLSEDFPEYLKWGIHVMAAQNGVGEITVGDSHEYGLSFDPFDKKHINTLIIRYLNSFARFKSNRVTQTWHGIYAKTRDGQTETILQPENGVTILTGLGGNGMTLSFGLCEEIVKKI